MKQTNIYLYKEAIFDIDFFEYRSSFYENI